MAASIDDAAYAAATGLLQLKCSHESQAMMNLFRNLAPGNFNVQDVMSFRSKRIFGGRCCWTVFYTPLPGVQINTKSLYRKALEEIIEDNGKPMKSKVVLSGRLGSSSYGIFVTYGCRCCRCVQDFRNISTQLHLEPRTYTVVSDVLANRDEYDDDLEFLYLDNVRELEILYRTPQNTTFEALLIISIDMVDLEVFMDELFGGLIAIYEKATSSASATQIGAIASSK